MKLLGQITIPAGLVRNNYTTGAASKDFSSVAAGNFDSILRATQGGTAGNSITVALNMDSADGVTIDLDGTDVTIHAEDGVSTVADVEAAIAALTTSTATGLIAVDVPGTGATVLTNLDEFASQALAGGAAGSFVIPATTRGIYLEASADGLRYESAPSPVTPSTLSATSTDFKLYGGNAFGEVCGPLGAVLAVAAYNGTGGSLTLSVYTPLAAN